MIDIRVYEYYVKSIVVDRKVCVAIYSRIYELHHTLGGITLAR